MTAVAADPAAGWRAMVAGRSSCRAFTDEELAPELLLELFTLAQRAASWCNAQPWTVELVSGQARRRLATALDAAYRSRPPQWDLEPPVEYLGVYQERRTGAGAALYGATGVPREDMVGRVEQMRRNFEFFGAPHVAVVTAAADLGPYALVDVGAYLATVLWTAEALGVGAIVQAAPARHSDLLRDVLAIPPAQRVVGCIALGYADPAHPANQFRTDRAELDEVLRVHAV